MSSSRLTSEIKVGGRSQHGFRQLISSLVSDSCDITIDGETVQQYQTNPNKLTKPEIIFYWEIILLVLHLALGGTSILLQRLEKEVRSDSEIFSTRVV